MGNNDPLRVRFEGSQPILRLESMAASLRFGQGRGGAWIWIGVEDVEKLHEEYKARGVAIRLPPTNYPWALEMHVEDPDGNVIRFGSEPR